MKPRELNVWILIHTFRLRMYAMCVIHSSDIIFTYGNTNNREMIQNIIDSLFYRFYPGFC